MKMLAAVALLVVGVFAAMSFAEKRRPGAAQYVPPGFTPLEAGLPVALDVAGGRDKVYLQQAVDPANINLLWSVRPVGDAVMFVSRVDGMALDANGGKGNPYPRAADPANVNHLWVLAKVGERYMIWSKVNGTVLDANGGKGRPYLSEKPDVRNVNHLWELRPVGEFVMIVPAVRLMPLDLIDRLP
ncbi:MAG TPA: hypothetical protein VFG68_01235 [Fimbriiglobus sp.]|nr:hypothetical protein [Fimbriiglobus sp.]